MNDEIVHDRDGDGIDRRGFLKCMAWAGTGVVWTVAGGLPLSCALRKPGAVNAASPTTADLTFVQISDSHIGFSKEANKDVVGTLQAAVDQINALPNPPEFVIHTGDISHLTKPEEFDTADQVLKGIKTSRIIYVPGEHDVLNDNGKSYLDRYGKGSVGGGWQSFDDKGVHFIGLVNVLNLKAGGMGSLGADQLAWLQKDLSRMRASTPIVVFAHVPLWSVYPPWGWGTEDSAQALSMLQRFGSVTVLNGHIHQVMQKVEGNVTFHTARSTAFPQPEPGKASGPGPMKVESGELRNYLGISTVGYTRGHHPLAVVDSTLTGAEKSASATSADASDPQVVIDNFTFTPANLRIKFGSTVTWINHDDMPHTVVSTENRFKSKALDTNDKFSYKFTAKGAYRYFCSVHPQMKGTVTVA